MPLTVSKTVINIFQRANQKFQLYRHIILIPLHRKKNMQSFFAMCKKTAMCNLLHHVSLSFFSSKTINKEKPLIVIKWAKVYRIISGSE